MGLVSFSDTYDDEDDENKKSGRDEQDAIEERHNHGRYDFQDFHFLHPIQ